MADLLNAHTLTAVAFIAVLGLIACAVNAWLGLEKPWLQWWALVRAILQLGILSLVLHFVTMDVRWVFVFLVLMVLAGSYLVKQRLDWNWGQGAQAAFVLTVASAVPAGLAFGIGVIDFQPNYVLAVGGSIVGNMMSISTLFGRTFKQQLIEGRDQVEGWLALGAAPRQAVRTQARQAGSLALMPTTDQTRVTGIVTLPGSFVGALFGGLSAVDAAIFQLVVLGNALAGGAIAVAMWTWLLGSPKVLPQLEANA